MRMCLMSKSKKQVVAAFQVVVEKLVQNGYFETVTTYFKHGEYEQGPAVKVDAADLRIEWDDSTYYGAYWRVSYTTEFKACEISGADYGLWTPVFFGFEGIKIPAAFYTNTEAYDWAEAYAATL
jgi:hypothetical protein